MEYALIVTGLFVLILAVAGLGVLLGLGHEENGPRSGDGDTGRSG